MAGNPIQYAERTLNVHGVHDDAEQMLALLSEAHAELVQTLAQKRSLAEELLQAEAVLANDERAKCADMSQSAFERHFRTTAALDPNISKIRQAQAEVQTSIDTGEMLVREREFHIKTATARMVELGGLLTFYAASKTATAQATQP